MFQVCGMICARIVFSHYLGNRIKHMNVVNFSLWMIQLNKIINYMENNYVYMYSTTLPPSQGVELTIGRKTEEGPDTTKRVPRERGLERGRRCSSNEPHRAWDEPEQDPATGPSHGDVAQQTDETGNHAGARPIGRTVECQRHPSMSNRGGGQNRAYRPPAPILLRNQ